MKARSKLTDEQILAMSEAPWQWQAQLRDEAARRNLAVTSVTAIMDVVAALRRDIDAR